MAAPGVPDTEDRLRGALWGLFAGDAVAAPSHWYYGGAAQVRQDYGGPIKGYVKPAEKLRGSIMSKSSTDGGGRGSFADGSKTIIGDVINHGKKQYWTPTGSYHYHVTLSAGESTLEASLARLLMKSVVATGGVFDEKHFRASYVEFMQRPGSHNDTYASTCHRMFFANLVHKGKAAEDCPDNDGHNVDTIDGLVLPTVTALACAFRGESAAKARATAARTAAVTRNSKALEAAAGVWADVLQGALNGDLHASLKRGASQLGVRLDASDAMYEKANVWSALLANANVGGENVHRGAVLGAALGANAGAAALPAALKDGLFKSAGLAIEIDAFVAALKAAKV